MAKLHWGEHLKRLAMQFTDRLVELPIKLLSIKGIIWMVATYLFYIDKLGVYWWMFITAAFMGLRYLEKFLGARSEEPEPEHRVGFDAEPDKPKSPPNNTTAAKDY